MPLDTPVAEQLNFWLDRLAGPLPRYDSLLDYPRPPVQAYLRAEESLALDTVVSRRLAQRRHSLLELWLAAFKALLVRHTGQTDALVGVLAGANPLPLRTDLSGHPTAAQLLQRVAGSVRAAAAHAAVPFETLATRVDNTPLDRASIFQMMLVLPNGPDLTGRPPAGDDLRRAGSHLARCDVVLRATAGNLTAEYDSQLFAPDTIRRWLAHLQNLLAGLLDTPDTRLAALPLLTAAERQQLLVDWNATTVPYPRHRCIHQLFEAQAAHRPTAVAIEFEGSRLTYAELNTRANRLARHLQHMGVGPESRVGVFIERSPEMIVALLAVLKAGGAYVPLDTGYPRDRLRLMLADTQTPVVLTLSHLAANLPHAPAQVISLDTGWPRLAAENPANLKNRTGPDNLAYVMYTSGSTGQPKGIAVPHRGVGRLVQAANYASLSPDEVFLQLAPISFDAATLEIWGALLNGAKLVVMPPAPPSLAELARAIAHHRVSILWLTAGLFHQMAEAHPDVLAGVRQLLAGGDVLQVALVQKILAKMEGRTLVNGYGPTENTTFTCCYPMTDPAQVGRTVPIGRPISNSQIFILNEALQPVPVGCPGELYIGGDGLARGYINRPDLTAASFVPHPFSRRPGDRLYKTGDLVRWLPDGTVEFLGRRDQQVKIRGFRIELGEIETLLGRHSAVGRVVVRALLNEAGQKYLAAYLVPSNSTPVSLGQSPGELRRELRRYLQQHLPDYMQPAAFIFLDELPLDPNGKVDRTALPAPELSRPELEAKYAPPRDREEAMLVEIWREVLGFEQIGIHDDFFALGGHSLLATRVISRLHTLFQVDLPLATLFESPTIAALAQALRRASQKSDQSQAAAGPTIVPRPDTGPVPLSFGQERLWFLDQLEPQNPAYNVPTWVITFAGRLDIPALEHSLEALVERQQSLRTTFPRQQGRSVQQVNPARLSLRRLELTHLPPAERQPELQRLARAEADRPFDLANGPLVRLTLVKLEEQRHALLVSMHHIVTDGWSLGVFLRELAALYRAAVSTDTEAPALPSLPIQYPDFAAWQRRRVAEGGLDSQLDYWREALAGAPPVLLLPLDHPRPVESGRHAGARQAVVVPARLSTELAELSRQQGVTLFMTLLAAFFVLLQRYTRQTDICIGTPIANRNRPEIEGLIGFFVNTLVLRADLSDHPTFRQLLQQVKQRSLAAFANPDAPFGKLVEMLQPERDFSLTPLFQVMFTLQNVARPDVDLPDLAVTVSEVAGSTAKFDLELELAETPLGLRGWFEYDAALFETATIERLAGHWLTLLAGIVAHPDAPIATLPLLTQAERQRLLIEFNRTGHDFPLAAPFAQQIEAQVEKTPEAVAVTCGESSLTYRQLNAGANRLARRLVDRGVGPESVVALLAGRDIDFLTIMLAVFKAGAAYLPLDPLHPAPRHRQILQQSRSPLVLAATEFLPVLEEALAGLSPSSRPQIVPIEPLLAQPGPDANLPPRASVGNLAYVIFTSGSTGTPKGAMVTQRGMLNHLWSKIEDLNLSAADVIAQNASQCFDISVWQFLAALLVGGQTRIFKNEIAHDPPRLLAEVARRRVTIFQVVPSLLRAIIQATGGVAPPNLTALRWVVPTGEALTTELARQWLTLYPNIPLLNAYGSTECSDDQCHHPLRRLPPDFHLVGIPIGQAMANVQVYILDDVLNPVPVGVAGELYVGGTGVGRGYLHDPGRTAEVFVPNPFSTEPGQRLYKTGDLGRYLPDGSIEFLGRVDFMVKIRGFRIELGEIEAALANHPRLREAVVLARENPARSDDKYLAAYVVAKEPPAPSPAELRLFLKERLPDYMIPAAFVELEAMPLTGNGKIDRRALPEPDLTAAGVDRHERPPQNPVQTVLAKLWAEVLELDRVGIDDDFFALGGHSLLGTQLVFKIRAAFQVDLPLRALFRAPTVAELAEVVENLRRGGTAVPGKVIDFEAEANLPDDVQPREAAVPAVEPSALLLTGATGFLGAFLLAELLAQTQARVVCLVRAADEAAARQRLVDNLQRYHLWQPDFAARLASVVGDLSQPDFGLSESDYTALAGSVQAVVHNAAIVNFVYPYRRLKPANVQGTLAVLRFAAQGSLPLHYISTVSVFDSRPYFDGRTIFESEQPNHAGGLMYGYAQSKWVAERLVQAAQGRGLPVTIFRPGTVIGDTRTGVWNAGDYLGRFIQGCIQLGQTPALDQTLNLAPVDFVGRAIVHLLRQSESRGQTFHVVSPHEIHLRQLVDMLGQAGYSLDSQPYRTWLPLLIEAGPDNRLFPLLPLFVEPASPPEPTTLIELLEQEPRYDSSNLQAGLAGSGITCPPLDANLLARYLRHFRACGLLGGRV